MRGTRYGYGIAYVTDTVGYATAQVNVFIGPIASSGLKVNVVVRHLLTN